MGAIKKWCVNLSKKSTFFRYCLRKLWFVYKRAQYLLFAGEKVQENLILFEAFMGRSYADSPKALYQYLILEEKYKDFQFIWAFKEPEEKKKYFSDSRTKLVRYNSKEYYRYYSKAKYWISNSRIPEWIYKKKGQVYIQTWHGTPLKKLGFDIKVKGGNALNSLREIQKKYEMDAKRYDYMISPSRFCTEKLRSAFALDKWGKADIIVETGYPRNDFLYSFTEQDVKKIREKLNLPTGKKIILYAPTWRDNQHKAGVGYVYQPEMDFDYLRCELSEEYIILFRAHYFVANSFDFEKYQGFIYNVSSIDDINELYIISDILVTDYSSVFFDYANLKRPILFYMYDLEEYEHELRDFYFSIDELPGPILHLEKELVHQIHHLETCKIENKEKYQRFNRKFNYLDDGKSSGRVISVSITNIYYY